MVRLSITFFFIERLRVSFVFKIKNLFFLKKNCKKKFEKKNNSVITLLLSTWIKKICKKTTHYTKNKVSGLI